MYFGLSMYIAMVLVKWWMKKNTSSYLWQTIHTPPRVWNRPFSFLFFFCFEQIHTSDLLSLSLNKSSSFCMIKTLQKEHQDLNTSQHNLIYRTLCWKCENKDDKKIASSTIIIKLMCTMLKVQVIQCTLGINGVRFYPNHVVFLCDLFIKLFTQRLRLLQICSCWPCFLQI